MAKKPPHNVPPAKPASRSVLRAPAGYTEFLAGLKTQIREAQIRAALAVNRELLLLYWRIGRDILTQQSEEGWGAKVIDRLGRDLQAEFPGVAGFSPRNLKYMRSFAEAWPDEAIVQQAAAQIPWFHNCILLDKVKNSAARLWYTRTEAISRGVSKGGEK